LTKIFSGKSDLQIQKEELLKAQSSGKKLQPLQKTAGFGLGTETGAFKGKNYNSGHEVGAGPGVASPSSG
jgi:hypothetical protein